MVRSTLGSPTVLPTRAPLHFTSHHITCVFRFSVMCSYSLLPSYSGRCGQDVGVARKYQQLPEARLSVGELGVYFLFFLFLFFFFDETCGRWATERVGVGVSGASSVPTCFKINVAPGRDGDAMACLG